MNKKTKTTHEFALYVPELEKDKPTFSLTTPHLIHRISSVLRLKEEDELVLFTQEFNSRVRLTKLTKKEVTGVVLETSANIVLTPFITVFLPLLKREALEAALYACVEVGVNEIKLITTKKSGRPKNDFERLSRIIISAAEQSKNFAFPKLHKPSQLKDAVVQLGQAVRIFADPAGSSIKPFIEKGARSFVLVVGPEGDLTNDEKEYLKSESFTFCHLTPTILRSPQAITVAGGILRSLL